MSDQHQDISTPEADHPSEQRTATTTTTSRGVPRIEDVVVGKIAGLAAREVSGVHALGGGASRMVGAIRESFAGSASNERQAAGDVSIVAEDGVAIHELAEAIRRNIITAIERMTGLEVTEVNVTVHDVHLDFGGDDEDTAPAAPLEHTPRVQ